ncbi:hypothetical protein [Paenibacillus sp.]|uniref:hypothetical protein n=1 Tax=Paenibacillus sp. TaxID=58172 RepID=UPI002D492627|nr:hypothetical protein [Paenibacillus sp.]HZG88087.1 hypothetical protein [Paenibacillus sp.]
MRNKMISMTVTFSLLVSMLPLWVEPEIAYAADREVTIDGTGVKVGNASVSAGNAVEAFAIDSMSGKGFSKSTSGDGTVNYDWGAGDIHTGLNDKGVTVTLTVDVGANSTLRDMGLSGHAQVEIGFSKLEYYDPPASPKEHTDFTLNVDGDVRSYSTRNGDADVGARSYSGTVKPNTKITITIHGTGDYSNDATGVRGLYIRFKDEQRPSLTNYTFTGNGAERTNAVINQRELFVKENEHITLTYHFSEPVFPYQYSLMPSQSGHFFQHFLFQNPDGTGRPAEGQPQYFTNTTYNSGNLKDFKQDITYNYTGVKYHSSGNLPLEPKMTGMGGGLPINLSMEEKFANAQFTDAAGNAASLAGMTKPSMQSNNYLRSADTHPFDFARGGYRIIVDAVAPKYTKSGNGIQPEILTGVSLNRGDTIEFTVQLEEETIVKEGWTEGETHLLFNNGMKAYYVSGFNTKSLKFRATIDGSVNLETPLLKVIALSNDKKLGSPDTNVLQDYAGNMLIQPANFDGTHTDGEAAYVNSKIDWAKLSIDNTAPLIASWYENGGATDQTYRKNGKITIDANDPNLTIPALDPDTALRGQQRPSKGIYRPSNMTGESSPAVGLVYYTWTRSPEDPFASVSGDRFAALKRYSLSAKQPREELYPDQEAFANLTLSVANNKTNMIAPPVQALTEEGSGEWYLHAWTADMTWDSARELMQYEKMKQYVDTHPAQYEAWKAEAPGSEADKIVYANNKALVAVGQYGDLSVWPLDDFKQDDSNWTHHAARIRLDNKKPDIQFIETNGNQTSEVKVTVQVADPHSGIASVQYQWVKEANEPQEIDWKTAAPTNGAFTASTLNEVMEDGAYRLYVKSADQAGNVTTVPTEPVIVSSASLVQGSFEPETNGTYLQSHPVTFRLAAAPELAVASDATVTEDTYAEATATVAEDVYANDAFEVGFALLPSSVPPAGDAAYAALAPTGGNPDAGYWLYTVPADPLKNGIQYVHVRAKDKNGRVYFFSKAYYFDNAAPEVAFSRTEVAYPQPSHDVVVTVNELFSAAGLEAKYMWSRAEAPVPAETTEGWIALPSGGQVTADADGLAPGETADYRLYVYVKDGAHNARIASTGLFKVSKPADRNVPPASAIADLLYVYGDDADGYTAIVKLNLNTEDKAGYSYSISPDGGKSWVKWRPFTNFLAVKVPTGNPGQLAVKVKLRTPAGAIGEPIDLNVATVRSEPPVYAVASMNTVNPVSASTGVNIELALPLGVKAVPSSVNPSAPIRSGNTFNVKKNGFYSFDLTSLIDPSLKDTLYVVVDNVDGTPPQGSIQYLTASKTNGNVTVKLETSEPVRVVNNEGRFNYTFVENGSFTFEFMDEAGNIGTATASVDYIHKEGPRVHVVRTYGYGENGSQPFRTIRDGNGNVLYASGVTLEVRKDEDAAGENYLISPAAVTMLQNGVVSFTVTDEYGSTIVIKEQVNEIVSDAPQAQSVHYAFVDEAGNPIPTERIVTINGVPYAKGKMKATVTGSVAAPNAALAGVAPIAEGGQYTNQISGPDGTFAYSRVFSADGTTFMAVSDLLGNVNKVPVAIRGLDNKAPDLTLAFPVVSVEQNKAGFDFRKDLGGYTVSDNVSALEDVEVSVSGLDLSKLGRQRVQYTARDQVGNETVAYQDVVVVSNAGMLMFANDVLISANSGESALFDRNVLTFTFLRYNRMNVGGEERVNEWGTFDLYYQEGLYREGQMKAIATKLTYNELVGKSYTVAFPKAGWYTVILRNQEREREYATFFIGNTNP